MTSLRSLTRRRLCQIVGAFVVGFALEPARAGSKAKPDDLQRRTFAAFLEMLLPRDAQSASANDLHIDNPLWQLAAGDAPLRQLLLLGCQWLNMTGSTSFADLPAEQKTAIIMWMAKSDWNQIPRRFYELVRQLSFELYYSQTASWAGLPIQNAPQPRGYPPPWS